MAMLPRQLFRLRRTTLLAIYFLSILCGLGLSRYGWHVHVSVVVIAAVLGLLFYPKRRWTALLFLVMAGLCVGLFRGSMMINAMKPFENLVGKKVVLQVTATEDAVYGDKTQLTFAAADVRALEPRTTKLPVKLKIAGFGENMVYRGDVVEVHGKLYKTRGGKQGGLSFAELKIVGRNGTEIDKLRRNFSAGMQNALPEPVASFGLGLLIGQRSGLPDWTANQLAAVGLTHIIAVSGYNLTIIVDAVRRLMSKRSKYQSVLISVLLMVVFILMTGFSASIIRAAIVSALGITAWYYGRTFKPVLLIAMTAAITALWNPLYLWSDIGWYLSFLAFFGVLVLAPLAMKRIYGAKEPGIVGAILLETTCAQIMTLPLIMYIFQQVSLVSIVSNLLVVPLVPLGMLFALIAGLAGMIVPAFSGWFAWPAKILLTYMLDVAGGLSRIPHALSHYSLSLAGLLYVYMLIIVIIVTGSHKLARRGTITDKKSLNKGA